MDGEKQLGRDKLSATTDLCVHIIEDADEQNAEAIADVVLRVGQSR